MPAGAQPAAESHHALFPGLREIDLHSREVDLHHLNHTARLKALAASKDGGSLRGSAVVPASTGVHPFELPGPPSVSADDHGKGAQSSTSPVVPVGSSKAAGGAAAVPGKRRTIAWAVTVSKDGNFVDGAAVLMRAVQRASENSEYDMVFVAICHPTVRWPCAFSRPVPSPHSSASPGPLVSGRVCLYRSGRRGTS